MRLAVLGRSAWGSCLRVSSCLLQDLGNLGFHAARRQGQQETLLSNALLKATTFKRVLNVHALISYVS